MTSLNAFFSPKGIAVIGASKNPVKLGYGLARNLVQSNYQGQIHFVNIGGGSLFGRTIYTSVLLVPDPVDLAIILIPALSVPQALHDCGERGIRAVIITSGGFRETGPQGAALEDLCLDIARSHQIRIIGPNCIGLLDTHLPIDATFLPPPGPLPGDVAFISHSGAICAAVIDWARGQGFGLSRLVSLGNQVDVTETDIIVPVASDPFTRVLTLYLEGVEDGRHFVDVVQNTTRKKPIIALKVGRFASGQRAVASHTGALAGEENAFNAAFRRAGVIRADTSEELFDWARSLAWCPLPKGRSVAVLTNAGGPGVTASDALEANAMVLADLSASTIQALSEILPPAASLQNPVDMLASATPEQYAQSLTILLDDPGVQSVLVILPPPPMHTAGAVAKAIIPVIHNAEKPVTVALMGERLIQEAVEHFRAARVPEYRFPERAASSIAILAERAEYLERDATIINPCCDVDFDKVQSIIAGLSTQHQQDLLTPSKSFMLSQEAVNCIMEAYGIPTLPTMLAKNPWEAIEIASQMGFPVAMKIASIDLVHKSDVDGVLLNVNETEAVISGFETIIQNARERHPQAQIQGVYIQPMLPAGQEVIIGAVQDRQFGPLVMFGSGGIEVEGLKDVAFALAPISSDEVEYIMHTTWAGKKLYGYRNIPPADHEAAVDTLIRVGQLSADFPQFTEIELNPLIVLPKGQGAVALDVRMHMSLNECG
jgi:acetate---CoA ligase (ADP-forming)